VFDLLHPGHLTHLDEARTLSDKLVVTLTSDDYVNKGPGRPFLTAEQRAEMLAALEMVDLVAISPFENGTKAISLIRPEFYVKGPDYSSPESDSTGNMVRELEALTNVGGKLHITSGATMSSSRIRNELMLAKNDETSRFLESFRARLNQSDVEKLFESLAKLRVLVVGESIIDTYVVSEALGKSSKDPVLAFRPMSSESQLGGALAIARHIAGIGAQTALLTRVGNSDHWLERITKEMGSEIDLHLLESLDEPTIEKTRYVDSLTGTKVFETYTIGDSTSSAEDSTLFANEIRRIAGEFDLVLVADYGHGLFDASAILALSEHSKKLAVNTQSNAGNRGFNTISKYPRLDIVCLNGSEVALEMRNRHLAVSDLVPEFLAKTKAEFVAITSGSKGLTFGVKSANGYSVSSVPAFAARVVDRVGAGDALFAALATALCAGADPMLAGLMGNLAGAASIAELGNRIALDRVSLSRHVLALLK
jgi:cytidyltransferase-like protein